MIPFIELKKLDVADGAEDPPIDMDSTDGYPDAPAGVFRFGVVDSGDSCKLDRGLLLPTAEFQRLGIWPGFAAAGPGDDRVVELVVPIGAVPLGTPPTL